MRKLCDLVKAQIRGLNCVGVEAKNYGPLLIPVVLSKIPDEIKLIVSRKFGKDIWDAELIMQTIESELQAREKLIQIKSNDNENEELFINIFGSGHALSIGAKGAPKCVFCGNNNHKPQKCLKFATVEKRQEILKRDRRCFLCLKIGHIAKNCVARFTCFSCKRKHHVAICRGKPHNNTDEEKQEDQESSANVAPAESTTHLIHDKNNILLQTARALITSNKAKCSANLRLLFDSGSQLSYISPRAQKLLNLSTVDSKDILIKTFGGNQSVNTLNQVRFFVHDISGKEKIDVSAFVSDICKPLSGQVRQSSLLYKIIPT